MGSSSLKDGVPEDEKQTEYKTFAKMRWHYRDVYEHFPEDETNKKINLDQLTPLECAIRLEQEWQTYYLLALHDNDQLENELKENIERKFPGVLVWAADIRKQTTQIARDLVVIRNTCKHASLRR
jgi:hypothetical protein